MPTKIEKDIVTGTDTTGHEWDGLKELNTPLPKWWLYVLYATIAWAAGLVRTVSVGAMGARLLPRRARLLAARRRWMRMCARWRRSVPARWTGSARCRSHRFAHGSAAHGCCRHRGPDRLRQQLPALPWGRRRRSTRLSCAGSGRMDLGRHARCDPADHHHGIRSGDPDARDQQMPRFGVDGILKPAEIQQVADYVMTLYGHAETRAKT